MQQIINIAKQKAHNIKVSFANQLHLSISCYRIAVYIALFASALHAISAAGFGFALLCFWKCYAWACLR